MRNVLLTARTAALLGFLLAGGISGVRLWSQPHVLEFQAGAPSPAGERLVAVAHAAALEGLGFGVLGFLIGLFAAVVGPLAARRGERFEGEGFLTGVLLGIASLGAWATLTGRANDALPFLTGSGILTLNLVGLAATALALACGSWLVARLPRAARRSPAAILLASLLAFGLAGGLSFLILTAVSGGWRVPWRAASAPLFALAALPLAAWLSTRLVDPLERLAVRARGGLLPRAVPWGLLALLALCTLGTASKLQLSSVAGTPEYAEAPERTSVDAPNVLFLTIDTLRADHLSCYGYERPTSPQLDALAAAGTRFADASSAAAWTKPATGTILTGLYPSRHGALYHGSRLELPEGEQTLAESFQKRGYVTAGFVSNPNIKSVFNFDRGFDLFFDSPVEDTLTLACIRGTFFGRLVMDLSRHQFNWKYENDVRQMNRHATAWLERNRERRFFLYLHYIDPHIPYDPPAAHRVQFEGDHGLALFNDRKEKVGRDLYDAEIHYCDTGIGELMAELDALGLRENTLIVVTSDHGEEFFEHGVLGHGFSLFQPVIHVPLILSGPGIPAGRVVEQPVQVLDLAATLVEVTGGPAGRFGDGTSFAAALRDPAWTAPEDYFLENEFGQDDSNQRAFVFTGIRSGAWKLVLTEQNAYFPPQNPKYGASALYDLVSDPHELNNLFDDPEHRPLIEGLLERLREHSLFLVEEGLRDIRPAALSPDLEAQLNALGY